MITAYDMLYKAVTHLYIRNNAYIYIDRDAMGAATGFYPLHVMGCQYWQDPAGLLLCEFTFDNGAKHTLPYADVIHLRRHFNSADVDGDDNDAIGAGLELANTQNQGIVNGIKAGANLRGILTFNQILSPEKLKENKEAFIAEYMQMDNNGGVAAVDNAMTYTPLEQKPLTITSEDQEAVQRKIYGYLGISEKIVTASYSDDEFGAFNESVIEPLALQMALEFTRKVYSLEQQTAGREIICTTGRLQFISNKNKVDLLQEVMPMGIMSVNQALEILGLPPVKDGDRRIQSLNYVSQSLVDQYQLFKAGNGETMTMKGGDDA